jgi:Acyl-CoA dehydrogenase, C-terminal domain
MSVHDPRLVHESLVGLLQATDPAGLGPALEETGWREMYDFDPATAVGELFDAQGEVLASSPMLAVLLSLELIDPAGPLELLPSPGLLPGPGPVSGPPAILRGDDSLEVDGCLIGPFAGEGFLTAASTPDGGIAVLEIDASDLEPLVVEGLDPSLRLARIVGSVPAAAIDQLTEDGGPRWERAVATCRLAIGHELTATAERAVALAIEHARDREQFGQPIGAFQAVQHRLADATVALEVARLALEEGWRDRCSETAALAKALAGRAGREVARHAQQVLGGIGFTWEHPFHTYLRRMLSLDLLLGSCSQLEREIGEDLLRRGALPELRPL